MRIRDSVLATLEQLCKSGSDSRLAAEARQVLPDLMDAHRCDQQTMHEVWVLLAAAVEAQDWQKVQAVRTLLRAAMEDKV